MHKLLISAAVAATFIVVGPQMEEQSADAGTYIEYYRDNLFLGLAYHRIGCKTNWSTIQSSKEYDGFTTNNWCYSGNSASSVPGGSWYDWNYFNSSTSGDSAYNHANWTYETWGGSSSSSDCSYNVLTDCNSDCWMGEFSNHQGKEVDIASGCWGSPPNGPNWQ
jgi:hypothetical protein